MGIQMQMNHLLTAARKNPQKTSGMEETEQLFIDQETFPNEWYLDSISVSEKFRGHGIGSKLLSALPKLAEKEKEK